MYVPITAQFSDCRLGDETFPVLRTFRFGKFSVGRFGNETLRGYDAGTKFLTKP